MSSNSEIGHYQGILRGSSIGEIVKTAKAVPYIVKASFFVILCFNENRFEPHQQYINQKETSENNNLTVVALNRF